MTTVAESPGSLDAQPWWLSAPAEPGQRRELSVAATSLGGDVPVTLWSPSGVRDREPLPLLAVNDGPDYAARADLTRYLAAGITGKWLPPLRAALLGTASLGTGTRDRWYSANTRYARVLRRAVIPAITGRVATTRRVGMGASLGALAMLHAHRQHPDAFDALFLQSGSFFCPRFDDHERRFRYYRRIVGFVAEVCGGSPSRHDPAPVSVVLTCGVAEENLGNNRAMTRALRAQGYDAMLHEVAGAHDYPAWRSALDPHLTGLLQRISPISRERRAG